MLVSIFNVQMQSYQDAQLLLHDVFYVLFDVSDVKCLISFCLESCFLMSLTSRNPPVFCRQGYLKKQGIIGNSHLWQHAREAGLMPDHQGDVAPDTSVPKYLTHASAAVVSRINFDL